VRRTADGFAIEPYDAVEARAGKVSTPLEVTPDLGPGDLPPNLAPGLAPS
jgi:hypothetical protein